MTDMQALNGRLVVVPGGTGNVGQGVVQSFIAAGATVVVPTRSQAKIDALAGYLAPGAGELIGAVGDTSSFETLTATGTCGGK